MHGNAMQIEENVKACLGCLRNTSSVTHVAEMRDVLVEGGIVMLASMLPRYTESVSAELQFKVRADSCCITCQRLAVLHLQRLTADICACSNSSRMLVG